ncbi:hypothetical protein CC86DRAFT_370836 [Ophiobolus disseminans]|uniref:MYND-type domain-containing protein n=1 Tax=Ophiobolus disseminans TaxID=1469910 RepID=A0A6A6ZY76_9PLEO|nr:hypothetical protein CC86DRAFT_370836 [Ophiobolus disseminans]
MANKHQALCTMCEVKGTLKCSGCESMHYCSKKCQKLDWPIHRVICKTYADHKGNRPSPAHHSVIYFPQDEALPRFMWLEWNSDEKQPSADGLKSLGFDPGHLKSNGFSTARYNFVLGRAIADHQIALLLPECGNSKSSQPNQSLLKVNQGLSDWLHGPVLAVGHDNDSGKVANLDLGPLDYRHAVDNLKVSYSNSARFYTVHNNTELGCKKVIVVRMSCEGDRKYCEYNSYDNDTEYEHYLTGESDMPTPVADKIGLPLVVRKLAPAVPWRTKDKSLRTNYQITMLNPPNQADNIGSVIVARRDGKPLLPDHLFALIIYTGQRLMKPDHDQSSCLTAVDMSLDQLHNVSKEDFEDWYLDTWKTYPISSKANVPSPYAVTDEMTDDWDGVNAPINLH